MKNQETPKHTQGEWKFKIENTANLVYSEAHGAICQINHLDKHLEEHNANTKLIAAAPELLDALKTALSILGRGYEPKDGAEETAGSRVWLQMQSAIKKATK